MTLKMILLGIFLVTTFHATFTNGMLERIDKQSVEDSKKVAGIFKEFDEMCSSELREGRIVMPSNSRGLEPGHHLVVSCVEAQVSKLKEDRNISRLAIILFQEFLILLYGSILGKNTLEAYVELPPESMMSHFVPSKREIMKKSAILASELITFASILPHDRIMYAFKKDFGMNDIDLEKAFTELSDQARIINVRLVDVTYLDPTTKFSEYNPVAANYLYAIFAKILYGNNTRYLDIKTLDGYLNWSLIKKANDIGASRQTKQRSKITLMLEHIEEHISSETKRKNLYLNPEPNEYVALDTIESTELSDLRFGLKKKRIAINADLEEETSTSST